MNLFAPSAIGNLPRGTADAGTTRMQNRHTRLNAVYINTSFSISSRSTGSPPALWPRSTSPPFPSDPTSEPSFD